MPPASGSPSAPRWSVMIPVYNRADDLAVCLRSVLAAGYPAERMQIAVVDDSTTNDTIGDQVAAIGGGRVEYYRNPKNLGMAGNWNRGIELARGELVQILHDDDYVAPEFYAAIDALAAKHPTASLYFSRVLQVDEHGSVNWVSPRLKAYEGFSRDPAPLFYRCDVRFPAMVARHAAYVRTGGFAADLRMTLDWDMWLRLIVDGGAAATEAPLAFYRLHSNNATSRYFRDGTYFSEMLATRERFATQFPGFDPVRYTARLEEELRDYLWICRDQGDAEALAANLAVWRRMVPWHRRARYLVRRAGEKLNRLLRV